MCLSAKVPKPAAGSTTAVIAISTHTRFADDTATADTTTSAATTTATTSNAKRGSVYQCVHTSNVHTVWHSIHRFHIRRPV